MTSNRMNPTVRLNAAPRCAAKSKRSQQARRAPAVKGRKVCRFHGAYAGAPKGEANGNWKHGQRSNDAIAARKALAALIREAHDQVIEISKAGS